MKKEKGAKSRTVSLMELHTQIIELAAHENGMGFSRALQFILEDWPRLREILKAQGTAIKAAELLVANLNSFGQKPTQDETHATISI